MLDPIKRRNAIAEGGRAVSEMICDIEDRERKAPMLPICRACRGDCKVHASPGTMTLFYCHRKNYLK